MASNKIQSEKLFLIKLAVEQFNRQYARNIDPTKCSIFSITADYGTKLGYEITTDITTDFLRLRIYLTFSHYDGLNNFRLETDQSKIIAGLGDEVYVAMGTVGQYYIDNGIYKFRWINPPPVTVKPASFLSGAQFDFLNGKPFEFISS